MCQNFEIHDFCVILIHYKKSDWTLTKNAEKLLHTLRGYRRFHSLSGTSTFPFHTEWWKPKYHWR